MGSPKPSMESMTPPGPASTSPGSKRRISVRTVSVAGIESPTVDEQGVSSRSGVAIVDSSVGVPPVVGRQEGSPIVEVTSNPCKDSMFATVRLGSFPLATGSPSADGAMYAPNSRICPLAVSAPAACSACDASSHDNLDGCNHDNVSEAL